MKSWHYLSKHLEGSGRKLISISPKFWGKLYLTTKIINKFLFSIRKEMANKVDAELKAETLKNQELKQKKEDLQKKMLDMLNQIKR